MTSTLFTPTFLYISGGLIIWAARFLAAYVFTALACAGGWSDTSVAGIGVVPATVGLFSLLAGAGCIAIMARAVGQLRGGTASDPLAENERFIHYVAGSIAALGLLAVIWETLPVFMIPVCA